MMDDSLFIKVLVVGNSGVGKTSILNQYCYNKFDISVNPTIGCDFCLKVLHNFEGKTIRLQLWDIAGLFMIFYRIDLLGQDRYTAVSKLYVKGALGCIVVTDITSLESLTASLKWKEVIEENADFVGNQMIPIVLLQNKSDLLEVQEKKEEYQDIEYLKAFAEKNNFKASFQVSAKSDVNLEKAIEMLLQEILKLNILEASRDNFRSERPSESLRLSRFSMPYAEQNNTKDKKDPNKCNC